MINIVQLKQTHDACPTTWEGFTKDNESVYITYRWGRLTVEVNKEVVFNQLVGKISTQEDDEVFYKNLQEVGYHPSAIEDMRSSTKHIRDFFEKRGKQFSFDGRMSYNELRKHVVDVVVLPI